MWQRGDYTVIRERLAFFLEGPTSGEVVPASSLLNKITFAMTLCFQLPVLGSTRSFKRSSTAPAASLSASSSRLARNPPVSKSVTLAAEKRGSGAGQDQWRLLRTCAASAAVAAVLFTASSQA